MRTTMLDLAQRITRAAFGATLLGAAEVGFALVQGRDLFLSNTELQRFLFGAFSAALSISVWLAVAVSLATSLLRTSAAVSDPQVFVRRVQRCAFVIAWPLGSWALSAVTTGRRVRDLPARVWLCVAVAALTAAIVARFVRVLVLAAERNQRSERLLHVVWLATLSLCALGLDTFVLKRLYPAFHWSLAASAWACAFAAAWLAPAPRMSVRAVLSSAALSLCVAFAAPFWLRGLATAPNARFAVVEIAPLTGKLLTLFGGQRATASLTPSPQTPHAPKPVASQAGIDLRGQDILLITIDALRADRLRAYGGHGVTPEIDALAMRSTIFTHAYTPTPHTSYAMGSLLTGKYLRPVLALPNAPRDHATLPRMLRRFGYRTAGFYPPAIFFVDQERFATLHADRFGLEYTKEMFAPAPARVEQVKRYLDTVAPDHPVFVWVHLFEPHEPYEPPKAFQRGDRPIDLYDGEVAAADASVGELVRMFRARRPSSTVIVTADHGEEFAEHGGYHHGTSLYDEQVHVPLIWSSAGRALPPTIDAPVELIDVTTTLLAALGVPRDARMRGDDLGALLAGHFEAAQGLRAFASIDELRMLTDGRYKALCDTRAGLCRGYDLHTDPSERHALDPSEPHLLALRAELSQLVASLPQVEAVAMDGGGGWPPALARARLGDAADGPELLPLLGAQRPDVRAEAVRAVARLHLVEAKQVIATLREHDSDGVVRDEAAVCALELADKDATKLAKDVLTRARAAGPAGQDLARRAAMALARAGAAEVAPVLLELAADRNAEESQRGEALSLLGMLGTSSSVPALEALLPDVRMRAAVVRALAAIGGHAAADAVAAAFSDERYPDAREAEAQALQALRDPRATSLVVRFLGTSSGVPNGVQRLLELGVLEHPSHLGADLRTPAAASARSGDWSCNEQGCVPGRGAKLALRGASHAMRVWLRVHAGGASPWLAIEGETREVAQGDSESSALLPAGDHRELIVASSPGVRIIAAVSVAPRDDIAPPAPEPYDAGVDSGEASGGADALR